MGPVEISMVFFKLKIELDLVKLGAYLKEHKILVSLPKTTQGTIRMITHHYIREK